jgi:hypothetical protein
MVDKNEQLVKAVHLTIRILTCVKLLVMNNASLTQIPSALGLKKPRLKKVKLLNDALSL